MKNLKTFALTMMLALFTMAAFAQNPVSFSV